MTPDPTPSDRHTVVAESSAGVAVVWTLFPLLGAAAGLLLKLAVGWLASLDFPLFRAPLEFLDTIPEPQATIGSLAIGALAGLVVALLAVNDMLAVTVADDAVTLRRGESRQRIERASVSSVFLDGKKLVLLGTESDELARESSDLPAARLEQAFVAHGYRWLPGDPHKDDYRRWVEGLPELSPGAHALLKARSKALEKGDADDVAELRHELAKLGIVVRDEKKRQYWRRAREV